MCSPFRAMLYPYSGPLDRPVWTLVLPSGDYVFRPTATRSGGPVVFTSPEAAERFLTLHRARWGALVNAVPTQVPGTLDSFLRRWRLHHGATGTPRVLYRTCYVDPRPPFGGAGAFDADTLPFAVTTP